MEELDPDNAGYIMVRMVHLHHSATSGTYCKFTTFKTLETT